MTQNFINLLTKKSSILLNIIPSFFKKGLISYFTKKIFLEGGIKMAENIGEKFLIQIGGYALQKGVDSKQAQDVLRGFGREIAEGIPGKSIEPSLAKGLDYIKEGMLE